MVRNQLKRKTNEDTERRGNSSKKDDRGRGGEGEEGKNLRELLQMPQGLDHLVPVLAVD